MFRLRRFREVELLASRLWVRQCGFTLVELMIGLSVTVVVVAAGFTVLTTTQRATRANDQVANTQQSARIAMDLISRDIKLAGFGMIGRAGACGNAIVPGDNDPTGPDKGPDQISLVVPVEIRWLRMRGPFRLQLGLVSVKFNFHQPRL